MSQSLPRLRANLDLMPSPVPERPGLLVRDSFQYSDATLIIPPPLVECLAFFDGESSELDLRQKLVEITGDLDVGELLNNLVGTLASNGFLEDETYARLRDETHRKFAEATLREAAHAGGAYPDDVDSLSSTLNETWGMAPNADGRSMSDGLIGIAAPHVSPDGGWQSYRAAYSVLGPQYRDRTFVILGTSHYGEPDRFGLTRKPFATPLGSTEVDRSLIDRLARDGGDAVQMEDYCHAVEHSIEFQVLYLQHIYGPGVRILPILCGSFARSIYLGGKPEDDENVRRFLGALGELHAREGDHLLWVLGIDMAHMGRRYGDRFAATADTGEMSEVAERDHARIARISTGDADGFWDLVQQNRDDLKWCGSAPLYTFLKAMPPVRGELHRYEQWNIDPMSVVSFAGISFSKEV